MTPLALDLPGVPSALLEELRSAAQDAAVSRLEAAETAVVGGVDHGADGEVANIAAPHGELCGADGEPARAW